MSATLPAWTVTQLERDLPRLLADATTDHERATIRALHGREVRQAAERYARQRKLTPGELAIAQQYGYTTSPIDRCPACGSVLDRDGQCTSGAVTGCPAMYDEAPSGIPLWAAES